MLFRDLSGFFGIFGLFGDFFGIFRILRIFRIYWDFKDFKDFKDFLGFFGFLRILGIFRFFWDLKESVRYLPSYLPLGERSVNYHEFIIFIMILMLSLITPNSVTFLISHAKNSRG